MSNDDVVLSPMTDEDRDWDDADEVFGVVMFRATSTQDEWESDPVSDEWDLSVDEAERRLAEEDYSNPFD